MENPRGKKSDHRCYRQRRDRAHLPQLEMSRVEKKLHHKVFPVNINTAPEVGETCSEVIKMVGFGQIKTKHVQ